MAHNMDYTALAQAIGVDVDTLVKGEAERLNTFNTDSEGNLFGVYMLDDLCDDFDTALLYKNVVLLCNYNSGRGYGSDSFELSKEAEALVGMYEIEFDENELTKLLTQLALSS